MRLTLLRCLGRVDALRTNQERLMTKTTRQGIFQPKSLALAVALGTAAPAYAVNFNIGEIEGQFDSSMSIGASWSAQTAVDKMFAELQDAYAFGEPRLRQKIIEMYGLDVDVKETFVRLYRDGVGKPFPCSMPRCRTSPRQTNSTTRIIWGGRRLTGVMR